VAGRLATAMTPSTLVKSALWGAFCFYLVLFFGFDLQPDLLWWLKQPLNGLVLIIISPAIEEWIFRGWLFDLFRSRFDRSPQFLSLVGRAFSVQNLMTTLCFCLLHSLMREPVTGLLVLVPSLLLGMLRDREVSLAALIAIHGAWNFGWFCFFYPT